MRVTRNKRKKTVRCRDCQVSWDKDSVIAKIDGQYVHLETDQCSWLTFDEARQFATELLAMLDDEEAREKGA